VYHWQGNYNLVARKNETWLFPTLRKLGITIQAYSPIAGGFLAKTPEQITSATSGHWSAESWLGSLQLATYATPKLLEYLREFGELSEKSGVPRVEWAYR
jgi:aryl-alcohol dehydrogenase-like predicted oxidoreductase